MYLELAENGGYDLSESYSLSDGYSLSQPGGYTQNPDVMRNYIFVPDQDGGKWLHMSLFDNAPMAEFTEFLDEVADYQPVTMREGLSAGGARKAFREQKQQQKLQRQEAKTNVVQARADKKAAGANIRIAKAGAIDRGESGKGAEAIGGILGKALETTGKIFGKGGSDAAGDPAGKFDIGGGVTFGTQPPPEEKTFIQKYGLYIAGAAVVGVGIYFATRKKR